MSFRKERKFRLSASDAKGLRGQLQNKGMVLLHPSRKITSQYFDTADLAAFQDSEEGTLPRFKIRVRWYNGDPSKMSMERKTSAVEGRFKTTHAVTQGKFETLKRRGLIDKDYGHVKPSALISYTRMYYAFKDVRITFDADIEYRFHQSAQVFRDHEEVVEIKAPYDVSDNFLESVIPVPTSRFSKYARAFLHRQGAV